MNASLSRAYYRPSFFRVQLPFEIKENLADYSPEELGTFVHEYVHFVQNFHTPWGLYTSFNSYERMAEVLKKMNSENRHELELPYTPELGEKFMRYESIFFYGNGSGKTTHDRQIDQLAFYPDSTFITHRKIKKVGQRNYAYVTVDFQITPDITDSFHLGAWALKESMAQLIQDKINPPEEERTKILPYDFVSAYCGKYAPVLAKDIDKQVFVCWASLFSMCPGEEFFNLIHFAQSNPNLSARELFYLYTRSTKISINESKPVGVEQFMLNVRKRFLGRLESLLKMQYDYFRYILSGYSSNEVFDDILNLYSKLDVDSIFKTMSKIGEPVFIGENNKSQLPIIEGKKETTHPWMLLYLYELIFEFINRTDGKCPNEDLCRKEKIFEYDCVSNPLMKKSECPMFFAAKKMQLNDWHIIPSERI